MRLTANPFLSTPRPEVEELEAVAQSLVGASGFTLLLARILTARHRQRLEQALTDRIQVLRPEFRLLRLELKGPIMSISNVLIDAVAKEQPDAVLLSGIEHSFELFSRSGDDVARRFGSEYTSLPGTFSCPLLIWATPPLMMSIGFHGVELLRDLARVHFFVEADEKLKQLLRRVDSLNLDELEALDAQLKSYAGRSLFPEDIDTETRRKCHFDLHVRYKASPDRYRHQKFEPILHWFPPTGGPEHLLALGAAAMRTRSFHLAITAHEAAGRLAAQDENTELQIRAQFGQADAHVSLGNSMEAMDLFRYALSLAKQCNMPAVAAQAANKLQAVLGELSAAGRGSPGFDRGALMSLVPAASRGRPTQESLRKLLDTILADEASFDRFCIQSFLDFSARHSMQLARRVRTDLLLQSVPADHVLLALAQAEGDALRLHEHLLHYE